MLAAILDDDINENISISTKDGRVEKEKEPSSQVIMESPNQQRNAYLLTSFLWEINKLWLT